MSLIHLARQGFITKSALPSVTRTRGASYQPSLLLLGNGTNGSTSITDSSQNALAVTVGGNAQISTAQKPTGMTSSIYFDGTGDYLSIPYNSLFDFSTGNWTVELFWYPTVSATVQNLISINVNSSTYGAARIASSTSNQFYFLSSTDGANWINTSTVGSWTTGQWYHLAFVRNGSTFSLYVNGVLAGSYTSSSNLTNQNSSTEIGRTSSAGLNDLSGYISNVRVTKGTALYTKNFFVPTLPLSTFAQQKAYPDLLLLGSGTNGSTTITDSSPNAFTITRNGDTNISTAQYPVGMTSSIYFDGTGDYLGWTGDNLSSGDWTVECWVRVNSFTTTTSPHIWQFGSDASNRVVLYRDSGNQKFSPAIVVSGSAFFITGTTTIAINTWYHTAVVRKSGTMYFYLNGVQEGGTLTNSITSGTSWAIGFQQFGSAAADYLNGYISNFRITKGTALYTGTFNVPLLPLPSSSTSPGASPSLYITGDGINNSTNIIDRSPNAFTVTVNGDTKISTAQAPTAMASSVYFDGTGDYLSVADNAAFDFGTGDFTIEAWVYIAGNSPLDGNSERVATIVGAYPSSGSISNAYGFFIKGDSTTTGTGLLFSSWQSSTQYSISVTTTISKSSWHHIAVSRSGTTTAIFLDGASVASGTLGNQTVITNYAVNIGRVDFTGYTSDLNGYLSNIRIIKGAALYTTTFVPPPLPILLNSNQIAYPSLLLRGAGANNSTTFTDSSPNAFTVTAFGDAKISTAQYPTGMSSSMVFDGSGDYLTVSVGAIGSGNFTIEGWFYFNSFSTEPHLIDFRPSSTSGAYPTIYVTTGGIPVYTANSLDRISGSALTTGTWHHIAIVRVGTSTVMYVNGFSVGSAYTDSTNYLSSSNRPTIGASGFNTISGNFNGYISNVRVVTSALYRSNFTPPPLPASATPQTDLTPATTSSTVTNNVYGVYQLA